MKMPASTKKYTTAAIAVVGVVTALAFLSDSRGFFIVRELFPSTWPALLVGSLAAALALFGETYEEGEGYETASLPRKIGNRRITKIGWFALALLVVTIWLGGYDLNALIQSKDNEWSEILQGEYERHRDLRYVHLPELGKGAAVPSQSPMARRKEGDPSGRVPLRPVVTQVGPLIAKDGDVIDYWAHCPTDNFDWMCQQSCGIEFASKYYSLREGQVSYRADKDTVTGKDQIVAVGSLRVGPEQPQEFAVIGLPSCNPIEVRVRGKLDELAATRAKWAENMAAVEPLRASVDKCLREHFPDSQCDTLGDLIGMGYLPPGYTLPTSDTLASVQLSPRPAKIVLTGTPQAGGCVISLETIFPAVPASMVPRDPTVRRAFVTEKERKGMAWGYQTTEPCNRAQTGVGGWYPAPPSLD